MEIVLAALVAAVVAVAVVLLVHRPRPLQTTSGAVAAPERVTAGEGMRKADTEGTEQELAARRAEIARL